MKNHIQLDHFELNDLLEIARSEGWSPASFTFFKELLGKKGAYLEDERQADWKYLLPLQKDRVSLVMGCGFGTLPVALTEISKEVYAVDGSAGKVDFLNIRKQQQVLETLHPIKIESWDSLPFMPESFDLISAAAYPNELPFQTFARQVGTLLKPGGVVQFNLGNRLGFQNLLNLERKSFGVTLHTLKGYQKILEKNGFNQVTVYTPLPSYKGVPMFYVPLAGNQAMNFFLKNIFPLFERVSPEVKQHYALQYKIARLGVRIALQFKLTWLARYFVPGFCLFAWKKNEDRDYL